MCANIYLPKGWYGVSISTHKAKTRSASSGFFIYADCELKISVQPFANIVASYRCSDRYEKGCYGIVHFYTSSLLPDRSHSICIITQINALLNFLCAN